MNFVTNSFVTLFHGEAKVDEEVMRADGVSEANWNEYPEMLGRVGLSQKDAFIWKVQQFCGISENMWLLTRHALADGCDKQDFNQAVSDWEVLSYSEHRS